MGRKTRKKPPPIKYTLRLYQGVDDDLIEGLDQLAAKLNKSKNQIVKDALRQKIDSGSEQFAGQVKPTFDLAEIRQVVEAATESALGRFGGRITVGDDAIDENEEEVETLLDHMGATLTFGGDKDE